MLIKKYNPSTYLYNFIQILSSKKFKGWGRKKTGRFASWCHEKFGGSLLLLEDGFIRSVGLGVDGSPSFSIVEDDIGIYYDATAPSRLESLLNTYDFNSDTALMEVSKRAMALMVRQNISKYNNSKNVPQDYFQNDTRKKVLVIAQTAGDASLKYGMLDAYTTDDMIDAAISENPQAKVYIKIHPDVLGGKKESDVDIKALKQRCIIIEENFNPVSLLKHFDKVYTKTSQMGFEALLCGCECVCFGMPFYAGWSLTTDKSVCTRRQRSLSVEEVFAAAYILYTRYVDPDSKKEIDIFKTIKRIDEMRACL